jgi:excisionase family DNA binding protein
MLEPNFYSIGDACAAYGCGRTRLYQLLSDGKIEAKKLGRKTLVSAASLKSYFASLPSADINVALPHKPIVSGDKKRDRPRVATETSENSGIAGDGRSVKRDKSKSGSGGREAE